MLELLVKQVQRTFSSKSNAGNLVPSVSDQFHKHKIILVAISICILIGYAQFRPHFECQNAQQIPDKKLTNFCWVNGTFTVEHDNSPSSTQYQNAEDRSQQPHAGHRFNLYKNRVINHNYMRSIWFLLILISLCSIISRRHWASIFERESLIAMLKLTGYEKLNVVSRVQLYKPYDTLRKLQDKSNLGLKQQLLPSTAPEEVRETFITMSDDNEHSASLDYYVDQLLYLLLASRASAYKMAGLKLRRRLLTYQLTSFILTTIQFFLPRLVIGQDYYSYGYEYAVAWAHYLRYELYRESDETEPNSVEYAISERVFPTSTICAYRQFGYQGEESINIQCTVSINEVCSKIFAIIWWMMFINIIVESITTLSLIIACINSITTRTLFGMRIWPKARTEANLIANFRYQHAILLDRLGSLKMSSSDINESRDSLDEKTHKYIVYPSERERKRMEATGRSYPTDYDRLTKPFSNSLYDWFKPRRSGKSMPDAEGFREKKDDLNMYFLFYLIYLRLGSSKTKVRFVLKCTHDALRIYLNSLDNSVSPQSRRGNRAPKATLKVIDGVATEKGNNPSTTRKPGNLNERDATSIVETLA